MKRKKVLNLNYLILDNLTIPILNRIKYPDGVSFELQSKAFARYLKTRFGHKLKIDQLADGYFCINMYNLQLTRIKHCKRVLKEPCFLKITQKH